MASDAVRLSEKSLNLLQELSRDSGESMEAILDKAIEEYRRKRFFEAVNADYAALRADPQAWAEYQKELALWNSTLMDGLDTNERWTADGDVHFVKDA